MGNRGSDASRNGTRDAKSTTFDGLGEISRCQICNRTIRLPSPEANRKGKTTLRSTPSKGVLRCLMGMVGHSPLPLAAGCGFFTRASMRTAESFATPSPRHPAARKKAEAVPIGLCGGVIQGGGQMGLQSGLLLPKRDVLD